MVMYHCTCVHSNGQSLPVTRLQLERGSDCVGQVGIDTCTGGVCIVLGLMLIELIKG